MPFEVKAVPPNDGVADKDTLDARLPQHPSRLVILGATGSGKSSWIYSALNDWMRGYYDLCLLFSPTMRYDSAWKRVPNVEVYGMKDWSWLAGWVDDYEKTQAARVKRGARKLRALVVFDDAITKGISGKGRTNIIDELFSRGRNIGISVWLTTQKYSWVNQNMRALNLSDLLVMQCNKKDLPMIADEHAGAFLDDKQMIRLIQEVHKKPYAYLRVDYRQPPRNRFAVALEEPMDAESLSARL